jgi:hypothetical protein
MLQDERIISSIPVRAYLDLDPTFNQLWDCAQNIDVRFNGHTHFVSIGQSIGEPDCKVPTCGRTWIKTFQPVVLSRWPRVIGPVEKVLTTVGNWRAYGSIEYEGVFYGQKAHSLRQFFGLPRSTKERFRLALGIHNSEIKDLEALAQNGWEIINPAQAVRTPGDYQEFVQNSWAEFGIAKSGYVHSRCGWFSDRSACYLASGRPVIAQETGFSRHIQTGEGLFAFSDEQDIIDAIGKLNSNYQRHALAAREIAERYFASEKVLSTLLEQLLD